MDIPRKSKSRSRTSKKMKKSGVRTKFLIESLRNDYYSLRDENEKLRMMVQENLSEAAAQEVLSTCFDMSKKASVDSVDELANKMAGSGVDDEEDAVGF